MCMTHMYMYMPLPARWVILMKLLKSLLANVELLRHALFIKLTLSALVSDLNAFYFEACEN